MFLTLLSVNLPILFTFYYVSSSSIEREKFSKKHSIIDLNSASLAKPLWDFDHAIVQNNAKNIAKDKDIAIVKVFDDLGKVIVHISNISKANEILNTNNVYRKQIIHKILDKKHTVGTLEITYHEDRISEGVWNEVRQSLLLFIVSTISVLLAAIFTNRAMIDRPLARLNLAIELTRNTGKRQKVQWSSSDELGKVSQVFNEMQVRLDADEAKLLKQSRTDLLTGLLNRNGFTVALDSNIQNTKPGHQFGILFVDLDRFKWVNDNLGHDAGDQVLKKTCQRIQYLLNEEDFFGRLGGDEFAIVVNGNNFKERAEKLAEDINKAIYKPFDVNERIVHISTSIGISYFPEHGETSKDLLKTSDVAMYHKKNEGRNGYCIYNTKFGVEAAEHMEVKNIVSEALERDWFKLYFQPIVELTSQQILGFESLLRLEHPELGVCPPYKYIIAAEQTGQIIEIGEAVLDQGMRALKHLENSTHLNHTYLTLNLSAPQFTPGLPSKIAASIMGQSVNPQKLVFEITETVLMHNEFKAKELINQIKELGTKFALDDFGTGYSSLSYLNNFPVDIVKIDRSFIMKIGSEEHPDIQRKTITLIDAIISLSHKLELKVVAEGIETEEQMYFLKGMGADAGQGYYFNKAQPLEYWMDLAAPETPQKQIISSKQSSLNQG